VRHLPAWVCRFVLVAVPPADYCLCCEPSPDPAEVFPSQFVLAAPPGRYQVETYDLATSACLSLESVEGGPLVGGLACTGHPVLVVVRALDGPNLGVS
jgi:hypothetical protein